MSDALDGGGKFAGADDRELGVVAGHDGLEVRELPGELAGAECAVADAEEQSVFVIGEVHFVSVGGREQLLQFLEGLAGDEDTLLAADTFKGLVGLFNKGKAVTVGGDHSERLRLDDQEGTVEGVAGFLVGDGEDGARDEGLEGYEGDAGGGDGRKLGDLGIVGARHPHDLGVGAAATNLDPMVFKKLDGDVSIWEELDVVVKLAGGDRAGAGLFDFGSGAGTDGLVEVSGGDVEPVILCFDKEVGQNWDGGLALDHALRCCKFLHQILAAYGNFHRCPLRGRLFDFSFCNWHKATLTPEAKFQHWPHSTTHCGTAEVAVFSSS